MSEPVKIIECPRDAWQALPVHIPAQQKVDYLQALIAAGFTHIDAVSFVSPKAVPQMSDSEEVLDLLEIPAQVELIGIVVNEKGAERAIATGKVRTLGFPYSISPEFLRRNQNQSPEESLQKLQSIAARARENGLDAVAYVSMAFGNPYGDSWSIDKVADTCCLMIECGINLISLADTVGLATPAQVSATVTAAHDAQPGAEIGVHLHARSEDAAPKIRAAWQAGCRRFDSAIGGLGGCPFAQDDLVGNIPTEVLLAELRNLGAELPQLQSLRGLIRTTSGFAAEFGNAPNVSEADTELKGRN